MFRLRRELGTLSLLWAVLGAVPAGAQGDGEAVPSGAPPTAITNPLANPSALFPGDSMGVSLGAGKMDGDWYAQSRVSLDLDLGTIGLGVLLPLDLLVYSVNEPPTREEKTYLRLIRKADWPAPDTHTYGRYLALLRYLRYGHKGDPLYAYFGQMTGASIGHGTILDRYSNSLDLNYPRRGLAVDLNADFGGLETFVNDIAYPATNLLGARAHLRPLAFGDSPPPLLGSWALGATALVDRDAPTSLATTAGCVGGCGVVGPDGRPLADSQTSRAVVGIDTEIQVLHNSLIDVIPYLDYNMQLGAGSGAHLGVLNNFRLSALATLWSRLEYRYMAPDYIPSYFDTLYDQQRYAYAVGSVAVPKAIAGARLKDADGDWHSGIYGDATLRVLNLVEAGAQLYGTPGVKNSKTLMVFATLPKADLFKVAAWYLHKDFEEWGEVVKLDERSKLSALGMLKVFGPVYVLALFERGWTTGADGQISSTDTWQLGLQTYFQL